MGAATYARCIASYSVPLIGTSRRLSRLGGVVVLGQSAHRAIALRGVGPAPTLFPILERSDRA